MKASNEERLNKLVLMIDAARESATWTHQKAWDRLQNTSSEDELRYHKLLVQVGTAYMLWGLAAELSLKLLHELTTGEQAKRKHDLLHLFKGLPTSEQTALEQKFPLCMNVINELRTSFEDWRYFHDEPKNIREGLNSGTIELLLDLLRERSICVAKNEGQDFNV